MADRYADVKGSSAGGITTSMKDPTYTESTTNSTANQSSSSSSYENSNSQNIDNKSLAALQQLIEQLSTGGTQSQKKEQANKEKIQTIVEEYLKQYSKGAAKSDAEGLVAQTLQKAMEANMPSITKSIEGAGTSASSMQSLLAQKLAVESSQAAGVAGLKASTDYGQISAQFASLLAGLGATKDTVTRDLLDALGIAKGATQSSSRRGGSSSSQTTTQTSNTSGVTQGGDSVTINSPLDSSGGSSPSNIGGSTKPNNNSTTGSYMDIQVSRPTDLYAAGESLDQAIQSGNFDWGAATDEQLNALTSYYNN